MKPNLKKLLALILTSIAINSVIAQEVDSTLVTVNGVKITTSQLTKWVNNAVSEGAKDTPELRQAILNDLVLREAVAQDIKKTGLLNNDVNAFKVEVARQNAMLDLWIAQYFKAHPLTDADVRAEYDKQAAIGKDPKNAQEYQLSQIVVASEAEGIDLITQLNSGVAFETLAKEKSLDKDSGSQGGLLGWALPTRLTPPIDTVIPNLYKGQVTQRPIHVGSSWHVIKVDDVRAFVFPGYEQAKIEIAKSMSQQRRQEAVTALMKNMKVTKASR